MKRRLIAGLPTALMALVTLAGLVFPSVPQLVAQNPDLVAALATLVTAIANFSPSPAVKGK